MAFHDLSAPPESGSCIPPAPRVVPLATAATDAFLRRPVVLHRLTARQILEVRARWCRDATAKRRAYIVSGLNRLENLRERLIAKLDAMDGDPDFEVDADFEEGGDLEPSLGSIGATNQRVWAMGGCFDREWEHDGREPEIIEYQCEDEGAQCEDEGAPVYWAVREYPDPHDQTALHNPGDPGYCR